MRTQDIGELHAFIVLAQELNFRRAAALLNRTPSTLSHSLNKLEARLGVRLLNRTTRTVALTEAGAKLFAEVQPLLRSLNLAMDSVNAYRLSPLGTVRVNTSEIAATIVIKPKLGMITRTLPDLVLEVGIDNGFIDIVERGYDAGIRLGDDVGRDMIAVRVSHDLEGVIVAAPSYWAEHPMPLTPNELGQHRCINRRFASGTGLYRWDLLHGGKAMSMAVTGPLILDSDALLLTAAIQGAGVAMLARPTVADDIASGRLVELPEQWCRPISGFHLYYPSAKQKSAGLQALIDLLRVRGR